LEPEGDLTNQEFVETITGAGKDETYGL